MGSFIMLGSCNIPYNEAMTMPKCKSAMSARYLLVNALVAIVVNFSAYADTWRADFANGSEVQVDPQTHKPTLYYDGSSTPLWNGVHKLKDGSVIIVRNGVVVPNESLYHSWSEPVLSKNNSNLDECEQLVSRTCGAKGSCASNQPCELAKQLQQLGENAAKDTQVATKNNDKEMCRDSLLNLETFPPCAKELKPPVSCTQLVTQTCGSKLSCDASPACDAARQLLKLGEDALLNNLDMAAGNQFNQQCLDALSNPFFKVCPAQTISK